MNWDPSHWKRSRKLLLGIATVWPPIYMILFMITIFSTVAYFMFRSPQFRNNSENIDLIQLEQKIRNKELSQITITSDEVISCDRSCQCEYHTPLTNRTTRAEIIRQARELDPSGAPYVPKIDENTSQPQIPVVLPIGFVALFVVHMFSVILILVLLPIYIVLAVKREQFDQTTRIVWIILICMMGNLAMPVYWYLYVWPNAQTRAAPVTS
jgi:hypothetical protein